MENDNNARRTANRILNKYRLSSVTLENIIFILEDQGFNIVEFTYESLDENEIMARLQLKALARSSKAFTYSKNDLRFVFVREDLSGNEKLVVLAHEEGHIACGHLEKKDVSSGNVEDEYEANEFAHYLLHPSTFRKIRTAIYEHKRISIILKVVLLCLIAVACIAPHFIKANTLYGDYYITHSGERYHEKGCIFIKDNNGVHRMTIEEFESGDYEPCRICLPHSVMNN